MRVGCKCWPWPRAIEKGFNRHKEEKGERKVGRQAGGSSVYNSMHWRYFEQQQQRQSSKSGTTLADAEELRATNMPQHRAHCGSNVWQGSRKRLVRGKLRVLAVCAQTLTNDGHNAAQRA